MRVLQVPVGAENPYQGLLISHLEALGLTVGHGNARGIFPLFRLVARNGLPDVLHLHWIQPFVISRAFVISLIKAPLAMLQLALLRLAGVRIVWTVHDLSHHENPHPRWDRFFNRVVARLAHHGITHCHAAARQIQEAFAPIELPMSVLPLPNYLPAYAAPPAREAARKKLAIGADAFVFLHLGLIRPYKGTLELVEAFAALDTDAQLLVVGSVPDAGYAVRLRAAAAASPRVTLIDRYVSDEELPLFIGASDVAVLPFLSVVNSSSVVLAMTYGLPVIASRVGCVPETLREDGGFMYDAGEPGGLTRALNRALAARQESPAIGERNRARAAMDSWEDSARRTFDIYKLVRAS